MQLDQYLEGLVKEANTAEQAQARVEGLSFEALAHVAGIKLAESVCSKCGSTMEKSGTMYKCSCGSSKTASVGRMAGLIPTVAGGIIGADEGVSGADRDTRLRRGLAGGAGGALGGFAGGIGGAALGGVGGSIGGAGIGGLAGAGAGGLAALLSRGKVSPRAGAAGGAGWGGAAGGILGGLSGLVHGGAEGTIAGGKYLGRAAANVAAPKNREQTRKVENSQDPKKSGAETSTGASMKKASADAVGRLLAKVAGEKSSEYFGEEGLTQDQKDLIERAATRARRGALVGGGIGAIGGGLIGKVLSKGKPSGLRRLGGMGLGGLGLGALAGMGVGGLASSMTGPGTDEEWEGILSAQGHRPGAQPGDPLKKTSAPIDLNKAEVMEALQGAKDREDIGGRSKRWGLGGGVAGGVGGGIGGGLLGFGAGKLLASRFPGASGIAPMAGGLLGGIAGGAGGGMAGSQIGRREGAEEAAADMLVARLRQGAAGRRGAMTGYLSGLRQGVGMGGFPPGQDASAQPGGMPKSGSAIPFVNGR